MQLHLQRLGDASMHPVGVVQLSVCSTEKESMVILEYAQQAAPNNQCLLSCRTYMFVRDSAGTHCD